MDRDVFKKAIIQSQHCQRNWDLSKTISEEDLELFKDAVTLCPSKQNFSFYSVKFITDRDIIEQIHENTLGFGVKANDEVKYYTNSQTLANLLCVFEYTEISADQKWRNDTFSGSPKRDADMAIGIAAGYLNIIASMLNYRTGYCGCFDSKKIKEILVTKNNIALLMGIGFNNEELDRRVHHKKNDFMFPAKKKEKITVEYI